MNSLKVIAITEKGTEALNANIEDYNNSPITHKAQLKLLFKRAVMQDPLRVILSVRNPKVAAKLGSGEQLVISVKENMQTHGAKDGLDYEVVTT